MNRIHNTFALGALGLLALASSAFTAACSASATDAKNNGTIAQAEDLGNADQNSQGDDDDDGDADVDVFNCSAPGECSAVPRNPCCPFNNLEVAINRSEVDEWNLTHICRERHICPMIVFQPRFPVCNLTTHRCEMDACPEGKVKDTATGACVCIERVMCMTDAHFDETSCKCVPNCAPNQVWDAQRGECVCGVPDRVLCIFGDHWDPIHCGCVPDANANADASTN